MAKGLDEIKKDVDTLTTAMSRLDTASTGLARSFGEFGASGNKTWNIISRLTSGTGFWRLQNRIRAVSNVFQAYYDSQSEGMKATLKSLDANLALAKSLDALEKEKANILKTPLYKMFEKDTGSTKLAKKEAERYYDTIIGKIEKTSKKRKKLFQKSLLPGIGERLKKGGVIGEFKRDFEKLKGLGGGKVMDKIFGKRYKGGRFMEGGGRAKKGGQRVGFFKTQGKNISKVFEFAKIGTVLFSKFLLYGAAFGILLAIVIYFFRSVWPTFSKFIGDSAKNFIKAFSSIILVLKGVFNFFKAIFKGDILGAIKILVMDIFKNLLIAVGNILGGLAKLALGLLASLLVGLVKTLARVFIGIFQNLPFGIGKFFRKRTKSSPGSLDSAIKPVRAFAKGGITGKGYSLVGEQGPELVRLPVGSRVFSNADSRRMSGGTNITVQVTGRVGASDQEIKDIARKVSREIGLQMNRTGSTAVRF